MTKKRLLLTAVSLGIGLTASTAFADLDILTFDANIDGTKDDGGWPENTKTLSWTNLNSGGPAGGSLYVQIDYPVATTGWQDSKLRLFTPGSSGEDFTWPGIDIRPYAALEMDVKVDTAKSGLLANGTYGGVQLVLQGWENANGNPSGLGWVTVGSATIQNTNDWQTLRIPVTSYQYNANRIILNFNVNPVNAANGTMAYVVDNVRLVSPPPTPPALTMTPAPSGLQLTATQEGDRWQRQNISTVIPIDSWHVAPGPVKIELDIKETTGNGWQSHIYLAPQSALPNGAGDNAPDWNGTNLIFLQISGNTATFRYKTNSGSANSMFWNGNPDNGPVGAIASLSGTSPTGTFSVTFTKPNQITMQVPGGASTNFTISTEVADLFNESLYVWFGIQANELANIGKYSVFSGARITGVSIPVNDNFAGPELDTTIWQKAGVNPSGIVINGADARWRVSWALPASADAYVAGSSSPAGPWTDLNLPVTLVGSTRQVTVPASKLPSPNVGFFALKLRQATKLQLLLPGETAAPGTPTGKTGTPLPVYAGSDVNVVINAVDDTWNRVAITDSVTVTSSDVSAIIGDGNNVLTLANGTGTMKIVFGSLGNFTVTATDTTDATKTPGTANVTVQ